MTSQTAHKNYFSPIPNNTTDTNVNLEDSNNDFVFFDNFENLSIILLLLIYI